MKSLNDGRNDIEIRYIVKKNAIHIDRKKDQRSYIDSTKVKCIDFVVLLVCAEN